MNDTQSSVEHYLFDDKDFSVLSAERAFGAMNAQYADYADIYIQHSVYEGWHLEEGAVKSGSFVTRCGFGARAVKGEKTAFAYADGLSETALLQAACSIRCSALQGQNARVRIGLPEEQHLYASSNPIEAMSAADKIALLQRIDEAVRAADNRVIEVSASLVSAYEHIWLARADGRRHADIRPLVRLSLNVIVEENGRREQGSAGGGARADMGYFTPERVQHYMDCAVAQAVLNLSARPAPAGEMTVVLGSGWTGVLLHEAVGHGLEGDFNRKETSVFSGRIGERVAAQGVTVIDQGNIVGRRGSLNMDDEGNATRENVLIEDGILRGYLQDETNARLMNMAVTGNGRRENYAGAPMPRMTNTFMRSGGFTPEEVISSVKKGIYAKNFSGGQVDITSGQFVFGASEAWLIENGRLQYPVKGAMLIGNGADTLKHIGMIADDSCLDEGIGVCGKDGQSIPVGVGMPTVRIDKGLTVGGAQV